VTIRREALWVQKIGAPAWSGIRSSDTPSQFKRHETRPAADVHANCEFLRSLFCCRHDRDPAHELNLPVRSGGKSGQERKNQTGDFIGLLVQGEMAGVE